MILFSESIFMNTDKKHKNKVLGYGMLVGMLLGTVYGSITDDIGQSTGLGMSFGIILGALWLKATGEEER